MSSKDCELPARPWKIANHSEFCKQTDSIHSDPSTSAALVRRRIAQHDQNRRTRQTLILAMLDYVWRLKVQNMVEGQIVGRLRRIAAHHDADAQRVANNRRQREAA